MKKAIVTGASGFVGYWLVKELAKNNVSVTAVLREQYKGTDMYHDMPLVKTIFCDLTDLNRLPSLVEEEGFDAFYHLAWISAGGAGRKNYDTQLSNVSYCCTASRVAAELGCKKVLYTGTITEKIAQNYLDQPTQSQNNIYGLCKHLAHCLVDIECKANAIPYVWMQCSNLYGPRSINGNIVGYTINELIQGKDATFGPADQPYDFMYIEDLAHAAFLLGDSDISGCYYVGSGDVRKLSEYMMEIGRICGKTESIKIGVRTDDGTRYDKAWFDNSSLRRDTGFAPNYSFESGIQKTENWLKERL